MEQHFDHYVKGKPVQIKGFFQISAPIAPSPQLGGHPGGVLAYPVAVVEFLEDGHFAMVKPWEVARYRSKPEVPHD